MNIRPLGDRIVVRRLESEEVSQGGIIIPDKAREKPMRGKVVALGGGNLLDSGKVIPIDLKIGDVVLFGKYAGVEVEIEDETLLLVREDDILAVVS